MYKSRQAVNIVNSAIRKGEIVRPSVCSACGIECKPVAHHHNYDKPLDVVFLCRSCHGILHAKIGSMDSDNAEYVKEYKRKYPEKYKAAQLKYVEKKRAIRNEILKERENNIKNWIERHPRTVGTICKLYRAHKLFLARKYYRTYRKKNYDSVRANEKAYAEAHRDVRVENQTRYAEKNRLEIKAYNKFKNRLQRGKITKPERCSVCGTVGRVYARNETGWSKDINAYVWMCSKCLGISKRKDK